MGHGAWGATGNEKIKDQRPKQDVRTYTEGHRDDTERHRDRGGDRATGRGGDGATERRSGATAQGRNGKKILNSVVFSVELRDNSVELPW